MFRYIVWPREQDIAVIKARAWVEQTDKKIAETLERIAVLKRDTSDDGRRMLIDFIAEFTRNNPFDARNLAASVQERAANIRECETQAADLRDRLVLTLTEQTVKAKHAVDVRIAEAFIALSRDIQAAVDQCKELHAKVIFEADKLGLKMSSG